jgi:hypothetical protein
VYLNLNFDTGLWRWAHGWLRQPPRWRGGGGSIALPPSRWNSVAPNSRPALSDQPQT